MDSYKLVRHVPFAVFGSCVSGVLVTLTLPCTCLYRIDDPFMWGFKGFPITDAKLARWVLTAEDICFRNVFMSYVFRVGEDPCASLFLHCICALISIVER